jgi:hypothetical protein
MPNAINNMLKKKIMIIKSTFVYLLKSLLVLVIGVGNRWGSNTRINPDVHCGKMDTGLFSIN